MAQELLSKDWDAVTYDIVSVKDDKTLRPEERLFLAIILQAVEDATGKPGPHQDQARSVLFSSSATQIKDLCLLLDIDYSYFLKGVKMMIDEGRSLRREV